MQKKGVSAEDPKLREKLKYIDTLIWALDSRIQLVGGEFQLKGYEYLVEPLQGHSGEFPFNPKRECAKKATQTGWTETYVLRILHGMR
jgi:hypothetical protein